MIRTVTMRGPFRDQDLAVLATVLRWIDQHNPDAVFTMVGTDPDGTTLKAGQALLEVMLPEIVMERFTDAERQLLVTLVLRHWVRQRDDPAMDSEAKELKRIVARLSGTDTVLLVSRTYPSGAQDAPG